MDKGGMHADTWTRFFFADPAPWRTQSRRITNGAHRCAQTIDVAAEQSRVVRETTKQFESSLVKTSTR